MRLVGDDRGDQVAVRHQAEGAIVMLVAGDPVELADLGVDHRADVVLVEMARSISVEAIAADRPAHRHALEVSPRHRMEEVEFHGSSRLARGGEWTIVRTPAQGLLAVAGHGWGAARVKGPAPPPWE